LSKELNNVNTAFNMIQKGNGTTLTPNTGSTSRHSRKAFNFDISNLSNRKQMSYQQAVEIHSLFINTSQKVQIAPISSQAAIETNASGTENNNTATATNRGYEFYCDVQVVAYGEMFLKVINLQETSKQGDSEEDLSPALTLQRNSRKQAQKQVVVSFNSGDEELSENIMSNERETYDPELLTSYRKGLLGPEEGGLKSLTNNRTGTELPLFSPTGSETKRLFGATLATTMGNLEKKVPLYKKEITSHNLTKNIQSVSDLQEEDQDETADGNQFNQRHRALHRKNKLKEYLSGSSRSTKNSVEKARMRAFKAAVLEKSYPKSFITLCFVFYGVMLFTFITQIYMKFASSATMKDLQLKNNLLGYSQERSYKAMLVQINALGGALNIKGALIVGGAVGGMDVAISNLNNHAIVMRNSNNKMLQDAYALDDELEKKLFTQNVRMFGTYSNYDDTSYQTVDTFQATQKLLNAVKAAYSLHQPVSDEGYSILYYISQNVMDDFSYANNEITATLVDSLSKQKETYLSITFLCVILAPFLLIGIGMLLILIILNQYRIEKQQMKALLRVRTAGMKLVSDRIKKFQKRLLAEETSQNNWFRSLNEDINIIDALENEQQSSGYSKKQDTQRIKYEKFRSRYYRYIGRVVLYLSILISINIWDWISTEKVIRVIYNHVDQISYANYVSNRVTVGYASFANQFISNGSLLVEHKPPLDALVEGAAELKIIQNEIFSRFLEVDGEYNPKVKSIIFDNDKTCSWFKGDNVVKCKTLTAVGQPVSLASCLTVFQATLASKYQDYMNVNKTSSKAIVAAAYINIGKLLPNFAIAGRQAQLIAEVMNKSLKDKINEDLNKRTLVMVLFCAGLVVSGVFIWFRILKRIREVYNDFKKVLQIFPPGLILSSYLLKKFLIKTSKTPFNL